MNTCNSAAPLSALLHPCYPERPPDAYREREQVAEPALVLLTRTLERKPYRQDGVVIRCMEVRRRDLIAAAKSQADASPQTKAA